MNKNKSTNWNNFEKFGLISVIVFILGQGFLTQDSIPAIISATCGIIYTFLAGKGLPVCYIFGVTGSSFYGYLAFHNAIWGNLLLYVCYYIPMQIIGYFRWNKNLKEGKKDIVKIKLPKNELYYLIFILMFLALGVFYTLRYFNDAHPFLDSITTVFSIGGMYLTVRRAIEQWIFWIGVNALSLIMWINVVLSGEKVYSTVIMWAVYLFLAIYFYKEWLKEIKQNSIR